MDNLVRPVSTTVTVGRLLFGRTGLSVLRVLFMSTHAWLADRTAKFDSSGIRKVFDLAAKMANPINLSIGQPDFAVPDAIKDAAVAAIRSDKNGYSQTQGIPDLRAKLQARVDTQYGHS